MCPQARGQGNLTFTHLVSHALVQALHQHRSFNVSVVGHEILHHEDVNLSFAVVIPREHAQGPAARPQPHTKTLLCPCLHHAGATPSV